MYRGSGYLMTTSEFMATISDTRAVVIFFFVTTVVVAVLFVYIERVVCRMKK